MDIFLLEDDSAIGIGLSYSLKNEGYGVTVAKTVKEALKVIKEKSFSLYILESYSAGRQRLRCLHRN